MTNDAVNIFEPVTITWKGEVHEIPAERGLRLAHVVETALIGQSGQSAFAVIANPPMTTLAMAYGAALRFAGVVVSDDEVYAALAKSLVDDTADAAIFSGWIQSLMDMLLPPKAIMDKVSTGAADSEKKNSAA